MAKKLNSLDRFRKQPGRLVLEAHGHCEIPAGCGGVVLRWRNPQSAVHVVVHVYTPIAGEVRFDGQPLEWSRIDLAPGRHLLTVAVQELELDRGFLMFAAWSDPEVVEIPPAHVQEIPLQILSQADGSWKYTLEQPDPTFFTLSFEDTPLPALVQYPTPTLTWRDHGANQCHSCDERKAVCLGLPSAAGSPSRGNVWVRRVFDIPGPQVTRPGV